MGSRETHPAQHGAAGDDDDSDDSEEEEVQEEEEQEDMPVGAVADSASAAARNARVCEGGRRICFLLQQGEALEVRVRCMEKFYRLRRGAETLSLSRAKNVHLNTARPIVGRDES